MMDKKANFPNERWTENEILDLLDRVPHSEIGTSHILLALDQLRNREIQEIDRATKIIIHVASQNKHSTPIVRIAVGLLSNLAKHENAFQTILDSLKEEEWISRVIRNLEDEDKRKRSVSPLIITLMSKTSISYETREIYETLLSIKNDTITKEIMSSICSYLLSTEPLQIIYATKITSQLGTSEFIPKMVKTVTRCLENWYGGHEDEILKNVCLFFERVKDKRSIPYLLKLVRNDFNRDRVTSKALAKVIADNPETMKEIWNFLEEEKEHYLIILMAFEDMDRPVDVEKLFRLVDVELGYSSVRQTTRSIVLKAGEGAKPILFELAKSSKTYEYEFALDCLEKIGVSFDEISKVFKKSPVLQVYDFFFENKKKLLIDEIWKDKPRLGKQMPRKWLKIEYLVQNIFSAFGFLTIYVEPSGRKGVDIIAFSPNTFDLYAIGCTTGVLKDDIPKLSATILEMERELKELFAKYRVVPIIFTSELIDLTTKYSEAKGMAIFTYEMMGNLLRMLRTRRSSDDLNTYIRQKIIWKTEKLSL